MGEISHRLVRNPNMEKPSQDNNEDDQAGEVKTSLIVRLATAFFYGFTSVMIMIINKQTLTGYKFPSFQVLGIGQMVAIIIVLRLAKMLGIVQFSNLSRSSIISIMPLPLFYWGNMLSGLGGTQALSLPMVTVLRRFSVLMTMVAEIMVLGVNPPLKIKLCVGMMIIGAIVAAVNDLSFNLQGYFYLMMNNICTTGIGVITKKKLNDNVGKYGLMYYNALVMIGPTIILAYLTGDLQESYKFPGWTDNPWFVISFAMSCIFGFILIYSSTLCVHYNSPLATTVIGTLKNIFITYFGMVFGGDYAFSMWNFMGINISAIASLAYTMFTFTNKSQAANQPKTKPATKQSIA